MCVCERERERDYRIRVFFLGGILCNFGTGATNDPTIIIVRKLVLTNNNTETNMFFT